MDQHQPQVNRPQQPLSAGEAYKQGFLAGHLAGWKDALAAGVPASSGLPPAPPAPRAPASPAPLAPASPASLEPLGPPAPPAPLRGLDANRPVQAIQPQPFEPGTFPQPPSFQQPSFQHPQVQLQPQRPDPLAMAARKQRRENQNINITLYVASLLMVAAASLFIGSSTPVPVRLAGVWTGTALFYMVGLLLHARIPRLKPAATAFAGTALAIIPFAGLATYNLGFPEAPMVWFLTSLLGTAAYIYAAVRLRSRLVVYLSLAFVLSTAWSSVAVLGAALAWYFTALIAVSAAFALAGYFMTRPAGKAGRLATLYGRPANDLGPWFAALGLAGQFFAAQGMTAGEHAMVLLAGSFYFAVMTFLAVPVRKRWNYVGLRLSLTAAAPYAGWLLHQDPAWALGAFTLVLSAQALLVAYSRHRIAAYLNAPGWGSVDACASIILTAVSSMAWTAAWTWNSAPLAGTQLLPAALIFSLALLVGMAAVPAFLPRGEWLPVPAAAAALLSAGLFNAVSWSVVIGVALAHTILRCASTSRPVVRTAMLAAARVLASALVASLLAGMLPDQSGKLFLILSVMAGVAALQLLIDTLLGIISPHNRVSRYSAGAWALAGTVLVVVLSLLYIMRGTDLLPDPSPSGHMRWQFLAAAVAMGCSAAAYSFSRLVKVARSGGWDGGELISPLYFIAGALATGPVLNATGAVAAWSCAVAFAAGAGLLLRRRPERLHRWAYWWLARAVAMLAVIALYQLLLESQPQPQLWGAALRLSLVLSAAMAGQLLLVALSIRRNWGPAAIQVDIGVTLALTAVLSLPWLSAAGTGLLPVVAAVIVMGALGVLSLTGTLRPHPVETAAWAAPATMVLLAVAALPGGLARIAVMLILVLSSAILAARSGTAMMRAMHFLLARLAATLLVIVTCAQWVHNPALVSLIATAAIAAQLVVQYLALRPGRLNDAVGEIKLLQLGLWIMLAMMALVPLTYTAGVDGFAPNGTGLRWVVAVELAVLAASSLLSQGWLRQRGASFLALVAIVGGAAVMAPIVWPGTTALLLLVCAVAAIAFRCVRTPRTREMRWYWAIATAVFLLTACFVDSGAPTGVFAFMWLVGGIAVLAGAQVVPVPWLTLPGSLMALLAAGILRGQVLELSSHPGLAALAGFVLVVAVLYTVRLLLIDLAGSERLQRGALVGTALGGGAFFALWALGDADVSLLAASAFTLVALLAVFEAPPSWRAPALDAAVLTSAIVWFVASARHVELGVFWAVLWIAVALGALAVIRYLAGKRAVGRGFLLAAAICASLAALLTVFSGDALQQLISLLVFVALLVAGLALDERSFTIWGAVGVATAVLWYLRGFTYVVLAILALALIGVVIWRLNRKKTSDAVPAVVPQDPGGAGPAVHGQFPFAPPPPAPPVQAAPPLSPGGPPQPPR